MLSVVGWISGITAAGVVIFSCIFGIFIIYKSRKSNAKLLLYMGLTILCAGLGWLGNFIDFIAILLTGKNMVNPYGMLGLLSTMWLPLTILCAMYVGSELMIPKAKWFIVLIYLILGIIFEICIFTDPFGSFIFISPEPSGSDLIDGPIIYTSPAGIIIIIYIISVIVFWGFGFLIKYLQSTGEIKTKFLIMSIGSFLLIICTSLDGFIPPGILVVFVRTGVLISFWLMYFGFFRYLGLKE